MEETGVRSLLNVPIQADGRLLGVVGFDAERSSKSWPEEDVRLLQTVAENFTHLLLREEALRRLREHAWYLEGLDRVSRILAGGHEQREMLQRLSNLVLDLFRCPPWRAKRRRVVPGSREATRDTRRAEGAKGDPKGASERGVQSYGRPVCSRNELAMLWRNAG